VSLPHVRMDATTAKAPPPSGPPMSPPLKAAVSTGDIDDRDALSLFGGPLMPPPPPAPVKSVSTSALDDHESYDLFGCGPSVPTASEVMKEAAPMASTAPVEEGGIGEMSVKPAAPVSPANYELFPALALTDKPERSRSSSRRLEASAAVAAAAVRPPP